MLVSTVLAIAVRGHSVQSLGIGMICNSEQYLGNDTRNLVVRCLGIDARRSLGTLRLGTATIGFSVL